MLCSIDRGRVTVWSRNGKDWTEKFQNVVEAVKSLKATNAMLDGEIVIVDAQGRSSFQKLQRAMGKATTTGFAYEVFDLILRSKAFFVYGRMLPVFLLISSATDSKKPNSGFERARKNYDPKRRISDN